MANRLYKGFAPEVQGKTAAKPKPEQTLEDWMEADTFSSFPNHLRPTAKRLSALNIKVVSGEEAIQALTEHAIAQVQQVASSPTEPAKRILKRYEFAGEGCWLTYGTKIDGSPGEVACVKPRYPRLGLHERKLIKYETPAKLPAKPIMPYVDDETAAKIFERCNVAPLPGESFWQTVWRCGLPIAITEGLKKALCLLAHGIPAIALRGVSCGFKKGGTELHDAIADFATPERQIYIIFDQDSKPTTIKNVNRALSRLSKALVSEGCKVSVPVWASALGKGIDDFLVGQGDLSQDCFDRLLQAAPTLEQWQKDWRVAQIIATIELLNGLSYTPERETEGNYLPTLPEAEPGAIHCLKAGTGAGKTTRIKDWVRQAVKLGWNVLAISPLNALGKQTAEVWELPHLHDFDLST